MSSLFTTLGTASNALDALEQAMGVVQNNVSNASTPGYVTQSLTLNSAAFNPRSGLWGGVSAGNVQSARNQFAEASVWDANQQLGSATQQASNLQSIQSQLDVSGTAGIPGALTNLYSAFSAWSTSPDSTTAQQQVMAAAQGVAQAFNGAASNIGDVRTSAMTQTKSTVAQINQIASQIAAINGQIRNGGREDGGLDAQLYNNLEQLSNYVDISVHTESDGSVTVLAGGQVPLVTGTTANALRATATNPGNANSTAAPLQQILAADGSDVTARVGGGQLGGLLQVTNSVVPSLIGSASQTGSLNELAQSIAGQVNTLLAKGQTTPVKLFNSVGSPASIFAATLNVNPGFNSSDLVARDPGPPAVANGVADQLAQLSKQPDVALGSTYTDYYSSLTANVGNLQSAAAQNQSTQTQVLSQAQSARAQASGVSLNDQAAELLKFQAGYQAASQALATVAQTIQYLLQSVKSA